MFFESPSERLDWKGLATLGDPKQTDNPYVREVGNMAKPAHEFISEHDYRRVTVAISLRPSQGGFGYISSSIQFDQEQEQLHAAIVAEAYEARGIKPLIIPVDDYYRYTPGIVSLVGKTRSFNQDSLQENKAYSLILTGFTDSNIFTELKLNDVPTQEEAAMDRNSPDTNFSQKLHNLTDNISYLMGEAQGNLHYLLDKYAITKEKKEDLRLLLVTLLLLQDKQKWQNLGRQFGNSTELVIVAPKPFHDAMNRLNITWGHGGLDYRRRAEESLFAIDQPLFQPESKQSYADQGLKFQAFKGRVEESMQILLEDLAKQSS